MARKQRSNWFLFIGGVLLTAIAIVLVMGIVKDIFYVKLMTVVVWVIGCILIVMGVVYEKIKNKQKILKMFKLYFYIIFPLLLEFLSVFIIIGFFANILLTDIIQKWGNLHIWYKLMAISGSFSLFVVGKSLENQAKEIKTKIKN